jgi:hypothetical protein
MDGFEAVATALRRARGVVVLTGAGVSVESGLRPPAGGRLPSGPCVWVFRRIPAADSD